MSNAEHLTRVSANIAGAIMDFLARRAPTGMFYAEELRDHVHVATGYTAPASADRVLRDLRQQGKVKYHVISRRDSLYRVGDAA